MLSIGLVRNGHTILKAKREGIVSLTFKMKAAKDTVHLECCLCDEIKIGVCAVQQSSTGGANGGSGKLADKPAECKASSRELHSNCWLPLCTECRGPCVAQELGARAAEMEAAAAKMAGELAEYKAESRELRNQEHTIRRLEEKARSLEAQLEDKASLSAF
jgi:hypothetical protein